MFFLSSFVLQQNFNKFSLLCSSLLSQQQHQAAMVYGNGFPPDDADAQKLYDEELDFDSLPWVDVPVQKFSGAW